MTIVSDARCAAFVSEKIGYALCPPFTCMGIEREGQVIAGAVFNQFEGANIHVSVAGEGWTRGFMRAVGEYVYNQLGCERMTVTTAQPKVVEFAKRCGGQVEGVMRSHFGKGKDATIVGILRDEYVFAKALHNPRG